MSVMKLHGKFAKYNPITNTIEFEIDPMSPDYQSSIEDIVQNSDKYIEVSFKYRAKMSLKDSLRKAWYGHIQKIIIKSGMFPSAYEMSVADNRMRESIFPANMENGEIISVKRMHECSSDELQTALDTLLERYPIED